MSKYTTQLRFPVEQKMADEHVDTSEQNWHLAYKMLGLDDYPIFEEEHREVLNRKILRRYWFREIGFETLGQFAWMMRRTMHEIMPYYNQMYESEALVTEPMYGFHRNYEESWNRDNAVGSTNVLDGKVQVSSEVDSTNDMTNDDRNVFQDTPMNGLDTGAIASMDYATNVTFDHGTSGTVAHSDSDSTTETDNTTTLNRDENDKGWKVHEEKGYDTSQSKLVKEYRDTFLNIDLEIVERLNDLFMGLW